MPWAARVGCLLGEPIRRCHDLLSPFRTAASLCASSLFSARDNVCPVFGFDRFEDGGGILCFIEYALHENNLQRETGDGTLVSSQERRAVIVSRINW